MRWAGIASAGALFLAAAAIAVVWWEVRPVGGDGAVRTVVIPPGTSTWHIGDRLARAGLVRSPRALIVAARVRGAAGGLRHGEYTFSPSQNALEIVDVLVRGEGILHRVTVPEGYTVRQIADALAAAGLVDRERFLDLALRQGRSLARATLSDLPIDSLEGYLFPDTYHLQRGLDEAAIVGHLLDRLDAAVGRDLRAAARARGLGLHQLLTVASMVEREAQVPQERPVIAGVIYNRLDRGLRLEIDATVLYALGRHKEALSAADLAVDSPYNTYRYSGLPPGPIANPGLASIRASAAPQKTPYLYYVLRPDGGHHFSRTYQEHLDAIRRYRP